MSRLVSDFLILIGIILGVRMVAEGQVDLSGAWHAVSVVPIPSLPFEIEMPSLALGAAGGVVLGFLANVRWRQVPARTMAWLSNNSPRFSYVGLSLGFAIVLLYY
ncbi:MAG: hypothetical protein K0U74_11880 [Alphaproteobacteria bacterium]|nr:hypothetical protein [Alphaproteobacteria bacterium]